MDEGKNLIAKNLDDLAGIIMQIRAADRTSAAEIMIGSFKFTCDTMTGRVNNVLHQQGSINYGVGTESIGKYEYQIQRALEIAAKMDLIEMIKSLDDKKLSYVISVNVIDPDNMTEQSVNKALNKIYSEVQTSLITKFGLMAPKHTDKQKALHAALDNVGMHNITTFHHVDQIKSDVQSRLTKKPAQEQPRPKMTG